MKGIVLTGGFGTRLRPITYTNQKQLIPVANKPIVFYAIEDLVEAGIKDIGIIFGPNEEQVKNTIGNGERWGANITYIKQDYPRGLAHAALITEDFVDGDSFVMYLGDNILKGGIKEFVERFKDSGADASILLTEVNNPQQFGIAELDEKGNVKHLVEKPKDPSSNLALVGIYGFTPSIYEAARSIKLSWRDELEITDAIQWLIEKRKKVACSKVTGWWKDTGKPEDILEANQLVLDSIKREVLGTISKKAEVTGRVKIGKNTVIEKGTAIRGPCIIGEDCKIGPNVFIGPYTSIGNNVTLKNTEIEFSIVFNNAVINGSKRIRDSMIGNGCKITSNNGAIGSANKFILGDHSELELV